MTLFFPDVNVWLALSIADHSHSRDAWNWLRILPENARLIFCRYTQLGILRLLTNSAVMGSRPLTLGEAWDVYDRWLEDPRVESFPEPRNVDAEFRRSTEPFLTVAASKQVGDCWLLAHAADSRAALVTFDKALYEFARQQGYGAVIPH